MEEEDEEKEKRRSQSSTRDVSPMVVSSTSASGSESITMASVKDALKAMSPIPSGSTIVNDPPASTMKRTDTHTESTLDSASQSRSPSFSQLANNNNAAPTKSPSVSPTTAPPHYGCAIPECSSLQFTSINMLVRHYENIHRKKKGGKNRQLQNGDTPPYRCLIEGCGGTFSVCPLPGFS
jgi:hypothetical protein